MSPPFVRLLRRKALRKNRAVVGKVRTFRLDNISTTCDSGWVDDEYAYLLTIVRPQSDALATAGDTNPIEV